MREPPAPFPKAPLEKLLIVLNMLGVFIADIALDAAWFCTLFDWWGFWWND